MIIRDIEKKLDIEKSVYDKLKMERVLFFDIETTGFDKDKSSIVLISAAWFNSKDKFFLRQYFAEDLSEEKELLLAFMKDIDRFEVWCSYNGKAFDEPFIKRRMKLKGIKFTEPSIHIDLYRKIRPYYKKLGMERCNLKSVEKYLEIEREDTIDGSLSVELYFQYLGTKDFSLKEAIMIHNYEDVLSLPEILKLAYELDNNMEIKRQDNITEKQAKYLNYLFKKNKITINKSTEKISKKAASRIIDSILRGNIDVNEFEKIIGNSY